MNLEQRMYDKKEAAKLLKCSVSKIEKMMKAGEIGYTKVGSLVRFRPCDLEPFFVGTTPLPTSVSTVYALTGVPEITRTYGPVRGGRR